MRRVAKTAALCIVAVACAVVVMAAWAGGVATAQIRRVGAAPWHRAGNECVVARNELTIICRVLPPSVDPKKVVQSDPTEFVQLNVWPPRTLASRGWELIDSTRARHIADSVQHALDARGAAGTPCGAADVKPLVLADEEWHFAGQRVRLYAGYDSVLAAPPLWRVSVLGYASTGDACADPSARRRLLTPSEVAARAREWFYDRLGL